VYFAVISFENRNRVKESANRPFSSATKSIFLWSTVAVQLRLDLFEFRLSGELFHFEEREPHFELLFQLLPSFAREHPFTLFIITMNPL